MTRNRTDGADLPRFDEAVLDRIDKRGMGDPIAIVDSIQKDRGRAWLVEALSDLVREIAENRVRDLLRKHRHATERQAVRNARRELAETPGRGRSVRDRFAYSAEMDVHEMASEFVYIPGKGRIPHAECTSEDLRDRAAFLDRLSGTLSRRGGWYREVADRIVEEGVATFGDLSSLPLFPNGETPEEMASEGAVAV